MTAVLATVATALIWLVCAIPAYRLGYLNGYEACARNYTTFDHARRHNSALSTAILCVALGPFAIASLLVVRNLTPLPPTRAGELRKQHEAEQRQAAARLAVLEAELEAERAERRLETATAIADLDRALANATKHRKEAWA